LQLDDMIRIDVDHRFAGFVFVLLRTLDRAPLQSEHGTLSTAALSLVLDGLAPVQRTVFALMRATV